MSAAMSALAPAWEALEEGMHKAPQGGAFPPSSPGSRTGKILLHASGPLWALWSLYALLLLSCERRSSATRAWHTWRCVHALPMQGCEKALLVLSQIALSRHC